MNTNFSLRLKISVCVNSITKVFQEGQWLRHVQENKAELQRGQTSARLTVPESQFSRSGWGFTNVSSKTFIFKIKMNPTNLLSRFLAMIVYFSFSEKISWQEIPKLQDHLIKMQRFQASRCHQLGEGYPCRAFTLQHTAGYFLLRMQPRHPWRQSLKVSVQLLVSTAAVSNNHKLDYPTAERYRPRERNSFSLHLAELLAAETDAG